MKDIIITVVLGIIMSLNFVDVITDIDLGVPRWHIFQESLIVLASGVGFVYLLWEMRRRTLEMKVLRVSLTASDQALQNITHEMKQGRRQYGDLIRKQFAEWQLTQSEQQVAILLLKGLSFKEIAAVRETREKTVRQQASAIYGKSNLDGRHAFSAWFLEDLMVEPV